MSDNKKGVSYTYYYSNSDDLETVKKAHRLASIARLSKGQKALSFNQYGVNALDDNAIEDIEKFKEYDTEEA